MEKTKSRRKQPSIDTGWAWMILVAVTTWNFIIGGTMKSYGLLYVEFITLFQCTPTKAGLIGLVFGIVAMLISPISGRLSDSYSARMMSVLGGIVACAGIAFTGYAPNLWIAVFSFGVILGGAVGVVDGPILATLGKYFEKRRTFANGIAFAGSSVGSLVLAPVISFLIDTYSVRGAVLLLAGLWLHICCIGALLRPFYTSLAYDKCDEEIGGCDLEVKVASGDNKNQNHKDNSGGNIDSNLSQKMKSTGELTNKLYMSNPTIAKLKGKHRMLGSSLPNELHIKSEKRRNVAEVNNMGITLFGSNLSVPGLLYRGNSIIDLNKVSRTEVQETNTTHDDLGQAKASYLKFLSNPFLIRDVFVLGCGFYAYYTPIVALPAYGYELGMKKIDVAWTVGLIGIVEAPFRICLSWMSDRFKLRPASLLSVSFFVMGVCGQGFVLAPSHATMIAYAVVHGTLGGLTTVLMTSVLAECVGVKQLGSAMGLAIMQMNLAISLSSTSAGALKQLTNSYGSVFRVSSGIFLLGGLVYCLTPRGLCRDPYSKCTSPNTIQANV